MEMDNNGMAASNADQWISFRIGGEVYAQPIESVKEVIPYKEPVPVPGSPQPVDGILNVRGEVIPVFSGHQLLNPAHASERAEERIIILDHQEGQMGISVDTVEEIVTVSRESIEAPGQGDTPIIGTTQRGDELLILLDLANCCKEAAHLAD